MKKPSILFIGNRIDEGGAGKMLKFVANECAKSIPGVMIYSYEQKNRPRGTDDSIFFCNNDFYPSYSMLWRCKVIWDIRRKIKLLKPDIICSFSTEVSLMTRLATIGIKTIVTSAERGDPYTLSRKWKVFAKWTYTFSDANFFQLEMARNFFSEKIRFKSYVIPNPVIPKPDIPPYRGPRKKTIVSAGRFVREKGFEILIEAFSNVVAKHPEYILIIYGDGPLINEYKELVEKFNLTKIVSFPGYVSDVERTICKDGIFVLSSRFEGIPNVLIEALSVGIPTISTNCTPGGPAFLTKNGDRGTLIPVGDVSAMTEAITNLIENHRLYESYEEKGPKIINELLPERIGKMWIQSFFDIYKKNTK